MNAARPEVLVVEDQPAIRRVLIRALTLHGLRVRDFESGAEVLAYASEVTDRAALLVTDVMMPGMNGFDVASALRRLWPALPVLIVSGSHLPSDGTITEAGPTSFLPKPFTYGDLIGHVDSLLGEPVVGK